VCWGDAGLGKKSVEKEKRKTGVISDAFVKVRMPQKGRFVKEEVMDPSRIVKKRQKN